MSKPLLGALLITTGVVWLLLLSPVAVLACIAGGMLCWVFRRK